MSTPSPFSAVIPQLIANIANPYAQEEAKGTVAVINSLVEKLNAENERARQEAFDTLSERATAMEKKFGSKPSPLQQATLEVLQARIRAYKPS